MSCVRYGPYREMIAELGHFNGDSAPERHSPQGLPGIGNRKPLSACAECIQIHEVQRVIYRLPHTDVARPNAESVPALAMCAEVTSHLGKEGSRGIPEGVLVLNYGYKVRSRKPPSTSITWPAE